MSGPGRLHAVTVALSLLCAAPALARDVFNRDDVAFSGAQSFGFESDDIDDEAFSLEVVHSGVTFVFTSQSTQALDGAAYAMEDVLLSFGYGGTAVTVTVSPPVSALGFTGISVDGCPGATYAGSDSSEDVEAEAPCMGTPFVGAADIGNIGSADISRPSSAFYIEEIVFVPPGGGPLTDADLDLDMLVDGGRQTTAVDDETIALDLTLANLGPGDAENVLLAAFLPRDVYDGHTTSNVAGTVTPDAPTGVVRLVEPDLAAAAASLGLDIAGTTPGWPDFWCDGTLTSVAIASADNADPMPLNNVALVSVSFDNAAMAAQNEICGDGIDNDCNGRADCADGCDCRPTLPPLEPADPDCGFGGLEQALVNLSAPPTGCDSGGNDADNHACQVPRGACPTVTVPAFCCDAASWSNPSLTLDLADCDVGVPGCAPVDPNYKEASPGVNLYGYGYTEAGQTMTYTLHYENIGNADAHDVLVIDTLEPDLDDSTLAINDDGVYDPQTRTIVWTDPVVPPLTPRSVSFAVDVRDDAGPGTRVRNVATIVFPDAVPPTRIDTNAVNHVIPDPSLSLEPDLRVVSCTDLGDGEWSVQLVNDGAGFAYEVTAEILSPPSAVDVTDGECGFVHPDDPEEGPLTVIPFATTTSADTVAFTTETPDDPCGALLWRLTWEDLGGSVTSVDVAALPDGDGDAVSDGADNCAEVPNPTQVDADDDGIGDACDVDGDGIGGDSGGADSGTDGSDLGADGGVLDGGPDSGTIGGSDESGCGCRSADPVADLGWWALMCLWLLVAQKGVAPREVTR